MQPESLLLCSQDSHWTQSEQHAPNPHPHNIFLEFILILFHKPRLRLIRCLFPSRFSTKMCEILAVIWGVEPCSVIGDYQRLRGSCYLHQKSKIHDATTQRTAIFVLAALRTSILIYPMLTTCPFHLTLLYSGTLTISDDEYKLRCCSLINSLTPRVLSFVFIATSTQTLSIHVLPTNIDCRLVLVNHIFIG